MLIETADFNHADTLLNTTFADQWRDIEDVLKNMPLHLKASDQAGLQGNAIFDPVGTNEYIKRELASRPGWHGNVDIPKKYEFLGTDVDFVNNGLIVEAQFSNYPFLLNNLLRSELFFKAQTPFYGKPAAGVVIITKAHMFPASNSTLYYEQAKLQVTALSEENVYDIPIRLVGLFENKGGSVKATWTEYHNSRYSRTVLHRGPKTVYIQLPKTAKGRATIEDRSR